jgi:hypothetical protein
MIDLDLASTAVVFVAAVYESPQSLTMGELRPSKLSHALTDGCDGLLFFGAFAL